VISASLIFVASTAYAPLNACQRPTPPRVATDGCGPAGGLGAWLSHPGVQLALVAALLLAVGGMVLVVRGVRSPGARSHARQLR
jgi:hypothetical protein